MKHLKLSILIFFFFACSADKSKTAEKEANKILENLKIEETSASESDASIPSSTNSPKSLIINSSEAIYMMSKVFKGSHSTYDIQKLLDEVMRSHRIAINEENYERCGKVLVSLRKSTSGTTEMSILENMLKEDTGKIGMTFDEQAVLSAAVLQSK